MKFLVSLFIFVLSFQINCIEKKKKKENSQNLTVLQQRLNHELANIFLYCLLNNTEELYTEKDKNSKLKIIKYLVKEANINLNFYVHIAETITGLTPLMIAAKIDNLDLVKLFIENGANVNIEYKGKALLDNPEIKKIWIENETIEKEYRKQFAQEIYQYTNLPLVLGDLIAQYSPSYHR